MTAGTARTKQGVTVWFTGLTAAGKSTISDGVCAAMMARGYRVEQLDGEWVRRELFPDLGFTREDRDENIRRMGVLAELLSRNGIVVLVSAISPQRAARDKVRERIPNMLEVYVNAPLAVCEQRDIKDVYRRARAGEIVHVTGIDDPYEAPETPEVECRTDQESVEQSVAKVVGAILGRLERA